MLTDKEFWEWCGFRYEEYSELDDGYIDARYWESPIEDDLIDNLPETTLDNLFKYAVPKLEFIDISYFNHEGHTPHFSATARLHIGEQYHANGDTPELALRSAIEKVIENKRKD